MKSDSKSWLPKSSKGGWLTRREDGGYNERYAVSERPKNQGSTYEKGYRDGRTGVFLKSDTSERSSSVKSVSGRISLPNGDSIRTVRRDVMDKALGRVDKGKK